VGEPITVAAHQSSTDWVRDSTEVQAPPGAAGVQIWCQIIADGRAWFDDVTWQAKGTGGSLPIGLVVAGAVVVLAVVGGLGLVLLRRRV